MLPRGSSFINITASLFNLICFKFLADFFDDVAVLYDTSASIHELQHVVSARISATVEEAVLAHVATKHARAAPTFQSAHTVLHAVPGVSSAGRVCDMKHSCGVFSTTSRQAASFCFVLSIFTWMVSALQY